MSFHGVLFERSKSDDAGNPPEVPAFFVDLNLDQVVDAITADREEYDLKGFFYASLTDVNAVVYRQDIVRDLGNKKLLESINAFAQKMSLSRRYLRMTEKLYDTHHKEGWFLEAVNTYCDAVGGLGHAISRLPLQSRGLLAFRKYLNAYVRSDAFTTLVTATKNLKGDLAAIQYSILIKGNSVRVRKYEGEADYSKEVEQTFEKFKQGAVKDYLVDLSYGSGMNHIEAQILGCIARLYPDVFANLAAFCEKYTTFMDETIRSFDREIQFYVSYLEYIEKMKTAGLEFCFPRLSNPLKHVHARETFDIALADKCVGKNLPVVCNDFYLEGSERIIVVSGPNQGGKTTFARTFGQLHYLASLGLPVPGNQAQLFLCDRLFTHFEREEDIKNLRGKLQDDLVRIHAILEHATPNSIIIMNEIFTSTTLNDAIFLSRQIMEKIIQLDLLCVCVTFIDELSSMSEKTVSMVSTVVPENPAERTYKILRRPADGLAYAISIAEKYRLTYKQLKERIQS